MLPQFYRFVLVNNSGQTVTYNNNGRLNLKITAWYIDPDTGKIAYANLGDMAFSFGAGNSLADGAEIESAEIDNTSNKYLGAQVQLEITHDEGAAADGTFDLYLSAGDATGEEDSQASGYQTAEVNKLQFIGPLIWPAAGPGDDDVIRSPVFHI